MEGDRPLDKGGERQPERDEVERAQGDQTSEPVEPEEPRVFTPLTPLGSAAPWAGSTLDPDEDAAEEAAAQRERARGEA